MEGEGEEETRRTAVHRLFDRFSMKDEFAGLTEKQQTTDRWNVTDACHMTACHVT